jgi:hypothetical protein
LISCSTNETTNEDQLFVHEFLPLYDSTLINELNTDSESIFGGFIFLELLETGDFYINDLQASTLYLYSRDGKLLSTFSNEGRGPGEFLTMTIKSDYRKDWMGIYDPTLSRVTIMDLELTIVKKTFDVDNNHGIPLQIIGFNSEGVFFKGSDSYTLQNYNERKYLKLYHQKFDSSELDLLQSFPATEFHATVDHEARSISLNYLPLGIKASLSKVKDSFIYINNKGLGYSRVDQSGEIVEQDSLSADEIKPYIFSDTQYEQLVHQLAGISLPDNIRSEIITELKLNSDKDSPIWFQYSFVDLNGRIWLELPSLIFENESRWMVWNVDENHIFQVLFEEPHVKPQNAIDDRIIAFKKNEYGLQIVQIYSLNSK